MQEPLKRETESAAMTTPSDDRFSQLYELSDSPSMFAAMYSFIILLGQTVVNTVDIEIPKDVL